ncbi:N-acetylmuramidase domain-containing protein, partial [Pseudomonas aeruginosa]
KTNPAIHKALKSKDWAEFARRYNGPDYKKNNYDVKLAEAYQSFKLEHHHHHH